MTIHIKIIGTLLILLAIIHVFFPKYFNWKRELSSVSLINRQMMYVHTFFIAFGLLLTGILCWSASEDLENTELGKKICIGFGIFWTVRLFIQFFGYSPALWKGKRLETTIHAVFTILWIYFSTVFWITAYAL